MTFIGQKDFILEVAKGNIPGHSLVHKFGMNNVVGTGTEILWPNGGITIWPTAAEAVNLQGGDAADDAAGNGAREVTVEGLDSNWNVAQEAITTNGTSDSLATSTSFWRIFRAWVSSTGLYGGQNTGNVLIENASANLLCQIFAGHGQSESAYYTVPAGKTAYLIGIDYTVEDANTANVRMFQRQNADDVSVPYSADRIVWEVRDVSGHGSALMRSYPSFPAKTDLWMDCIKITGGGNSEVTGTFDLILVDD